jgi:acyl carrier protein
MKEKLLSILTDLHPDIEFEGNTALIDDGLIDSFSVITLIGELSDAFDTEIPADKIVPENFNSVEAMISLIESLED